MRKFIRYLLISKSLKLVRTVINKFIIKFITKMYNKFFRKLKQQVHHRNMGFCEN